jgi:hypothetical protein
MPARNRQGVGAKARGSDYLFTWKRGKWWPYENLRKLVDTFRSTGLAVEDWSCAAYRKIQPGDRAYLLKQGKPPGIFGRGRVASKPYPRQTAGPHKAKWQVDLRFDVSQGDMLCDPCEDGFLVTEGQLSRVSAPKSQWQNQAAGIHLVTKAARELDDIINGIGAIAVWNQQGDPDEAVIDVAEQVRSVGASGQGFLMSPRVRKAIEEHAVEIAKAHYVGKGYAVEIKGKPYDLHCSRDGNEIYVEVKGTQTAGEEVFLTRGEVKFARLNKAEMALFVVYGVKVDTNTEPPRASGGTTRIYEPWDVESGELEPLAYSFRIVKKS